MKKRKLLGIMVACMLMLVGCGQSEADTSSKDAKNEEKAQTEATVDSSEAVADSSQAAAQQEETGDAESEKEVLTEGKNEAETMEISMEISTEISTDILVVYFSRTGEQYGVGVIDKGNTAIVADMIIEQTGADAFEILPQEDYYPYTYDKLTDVAKKELNDKARPAYAGEVPDLSQYSTIFIGAPVWWGDWPMILYTFFEENEQALAGKTLLPFSTHAGSGLSGFDKKLSGACPDSTVGKGLAIAGTDAQNNPEKVRKSVNDWLSGLGY